MRCHYEVMCLGRDATTEEIKKQYKKLALQWHPDKNPDQQELATKNFKEIAAAYAVLNDPQEKQWYDDHREAILRGKDGTRQAGDDDDDEDDDYMPNLFPYFSAACFSDYDDSEDGFYSVYSSIFEEIIEAEKTRSGKSSSTTTASSSSSSSFSIYPPFGNSSSNSADVYSFYLHWENFVTEVIFTWMDKYNLTEAPSRQVKRAMEKENLKFRETARKEYINQIRSLVSFIKKRDPRIEALETEKKLKKELENQKKLQQQEEEKKKRQEEKAKWMEAAKQDASHREEERGRAFLLADEEDEEEEEDEGGEQDGHIDADLLDKLASQEILPTFEELQIKASVKTAATPVKAAQATATTSTAGEGGEVGDEEGGEEEGGDDILLYRCDVCSKNFKSEMQLTQHCNSKVHRKKLQESQKSSNSNSNNKKAKPKLSIK